MSYLQRLRTVIFAILTLVAVAAKAQNYTTQIFDTQAVIRQDRTVEFTEEIHVTFLHPQHGIIRKIPVRTQGNNGVRVVHLTVTGVECALGGGNYESATFDESDDADLTLKIGEPTKEISGVAFYRIKYSVEGAITDHDSQTVNTPPVEFYWNMIPAHWATAIDKATFSVIFPHLNGPSITRIFIGSAGSKSHVDLTNSDSNPHQDEGILGLYKGDEIFGQATRQLGANDGMTVVLGMPSGTVAPPPAGTENGAYMEHSLFPINSPFAFYPPFIPVGLFALIYAKRLKIRRRKVTVAFEAPADLSMLEAGSLAHGTVSPRDFVAAVVSLAQLKMWMLVHSPDNKSFSIEFIPPKLGVDPNAPLRDFLDRPLLPMDQDLYDALRTFAPLVSPQNLKGNFAPSFARLRADTGVTLAMKKYLYSATDTRGGMGCFFVLLLVAGVFVGKLLGTWFVAGAFLALILQIVLMCLTSTLTDTGYAAKDQLLGLKEFITRSYKRELNYFAKTDFNQALYDRLLPYAIIFNAVTQWTQAFEGIELTPPDWYVGYDPTAGFWYDQFGNDSDGFNNTFMPAATTNYGSGGDFSSGDSGFSGGGSDGGGGGGGGDSW